MAKVLRGAVSAIFLLAAAPLFGQMGMRPPQFSGVWNPVVGAGAVYETSNGQSSKTEISIAVVGKEDSNGKPGYWMEFGFAAPDGQPGYMQSLIVVDGGQTHIEKMVMQIPGRPPIEMPARHDEPCRAGSDHFGGHSTGRGKSRIGNHHHPPPAPSIANTGRPKMETIYGFTKVAPWGLVKMTGPKAA